MVELKGSEKQVKWAIDIRTGLMNGFNEFEKRFTAKCEERLGLAKGLTEEHIQEGKDFLNILRTYLENNDDSHFFIENFKSFTNYTTIKNEEHLDTCQLVFKGQIDFIADHLRIYEQIPRVITWYRRNNRG